MGSKVSCANNAQSASNGEVFWSWALSPMNFCKANIPFGSIIFIWYCCQTSCQAHQPVQVTESDAVDAVELGLNRYSADVTTRSMCLVALLKLSSRFPSMSE